MKITLLTAAALLALTPAAFAATESFTADLKAATEVPAIDSKGAGMLTATYDTASKKLTYTATYKDLTRPRDCGALPWPGRRPRPMPAVVVPVKDVTPNAQGRGDADRRAGRRPRGRQVVLQRPHREEQGRRDPRPGR